MDADCRCETTDRFWRRVAEMAAPQCEWTSCHLKVVKMVSLVSQTFYHNKELKKKTQSCWLVSLRFQEHRQLVDI